MKARETEDIYVVFGNGNECFTPMFGAFSDIKSAYDFIMERFVYETIENEGRINSYDWIFKRMITEYYDEVLVCSYQNQYGCKFIVKLKKIKYIK